MISNKKSCFKWDKIRLKTFKDQVYLNKQKYLIIEHHKMH